MKRQYVMEDIAATISGILGIRCPAGNEGTAIAEITDVAGRSERAALVVIDAFGVSTWKKFRELTPLFQQTGAEKSLEDSFCVAHNNPCKLCDNDYRRFTRNPQD